MHPGKIVQFERLVQEFRAWTAIPDSERAPAAAWWWGTAMELRDERAAMPPDYCAALDLPVGCCYADAAGKLMDLIAPQASLASSARFPRKPAKPDEPETLSAPTEDESS